MASHDSSPQERPSNIQDIDIPSDVVVCIVALLPLRDVCSLGSCSREWRDACSSNLIWNALYRKRWSIQYAAVLNASGQEKRSRDVTADIPLIRDVDVAEGWRAAYISVHKKMGIGATSVMEYVKTRACNESVEVADYQKAMALLCSNGLGFQDVQMFLFTPKQSVLVNLLGLHYCLTHLRVQHKDAKEALINSKAAEKQICLRWWSLGGLATGYNRHDEMHVRIMSLSRLADPETHTLFQVIERGTQHEVLRVQISADFRSSAWIARNMHSQR